MNKLLLTNDEKKILKIILYFPLLFIVILSTLLTIFIIIEFTKYTKKNIKEMKNNYTYINKKDIKQKVNNVYDYIVFKKSNINQVLENDLKKDVLDYVNNINSKRENYIFIIDYKGKILAHQNQDYINKSVNEFLSKDGKNKFREVIKKRGGYISYLFPTKEGKVHKKTSFIKDFANWKWLIGTGYDDYTLSKKVDEKKSELEAKKQSQITTVIISCILITMLLMYLTYYFSSKLKKKFINYKINLNKKEREKERELIKSSEIYKNLFESNMSIILLISPVNGDIINANKSACAFYGYKRAKLLSLNISDINIISKKECQEEINNVMNNNRAYSNFIHVLSNKEKRNVRVYTSVSDYLGMPILYSTIQDVTNEYKVQDALIETENEFKALFEFSNIGLGIRDINANFVKVNKKLIDMLGYDEEFLLNKTCSHISYNEGEKEELNLFKSLLNKEIVNYSIEKSFIKKDGTKFEALLTMASIFNNKGEIVYILSSIIDISEIKKKDNLLFQQSKMAAMGEMIANIAHQWRQPLSIISTISTSVKLKNELNILEKDELNEAMDDLNESTQHLSQTIDDFRNFYKDNKDDKKFKIIGTFEKTFKLIEAKFKTLDICFVKNINDISLVGQENELIQVLINILNNASDELLKKENMERLIFIDAIKNDDKSLEIYIKDNAGGVPLNIIDNIFDSLFTTKEDTNGTGIGLYMSKMIIEEHMNGKLIVKNVDFSYKEKSYYGAEFNISIPLENLYRKGLEL